MRCVQPYNQTQITPASPKTLMSRPTVRRFHASVSLFKKQSMGKQWHTHLIVMDLSRKGTIWKWNFRLWIEIAIFLQKPELRVWEIFISVLYHHQLSRVTSFIQPNLISYLKALPIKEGGNYQTSQLHNLPCRVKWNIQCHTWYDLFKVVTCMFTDLKLDKNKFIIEAQLHKTVSRLDGI